MRMGYRQWRYAIISGLAVGLCWVGSPRYAQASSGNGNLIAGSGISITSALGTVVIGNNITIPPGSSGILVVGNNLNVPLLPPGSVYVDGQIYQPQAANGGVYLIGFPNNSQQFQVDGSLYSRIRAALPDSIPITTALVAHPPGVTMPPSTSALPNIPGGEGTLSPSDVQRGTLSPSAVQQSVIVSPPPSNPAPNPAPKPVAKPARATASSTVRLFGQPVSPPPRRR